MSVNKVILVGRLGNDPEMRATQSGNPVANFNIATSEFRTDQSGQRQENTEWHRIVVFGRQAETCKQYLSKGRQVYIEGRLQTRQWADKQGQNRSTTEIVARDVKFLGERGGASTGAPSGGGGWNQQAPAPAAPAPAAPAPFGATGGGSGGGFNDDDIPF